MEIEEDISIDNLLLAVAEIKPRQSRIPTESTHVEWIYSSSSIECIGCGRVYYGQKFHAAINTYGPDRTFVQWCPRCLDEELFWTHCGLKVERVEQPNSIEK